MVQISDNRLLLRLAWFNTAVHVAGLIFAATGMKAGAPLVELSERMDYLAAHPPGWLLGWGTWMICTLALIAFFAMVARRLGEQADAAKLAVMLACAGGTLDLFCDAINIVVLPPIASWGSSATPIFLSVERLVWTGGLVVANGMYSIGTLVLTWCLCRQLARSFWIGMTGYGTFGFGMVLVVAGFGEWPWLVPWATVPTIGLFCLWTLLVAHRLGDTRTKP